VQRGCRRWKPRELRSDEVYDLKEKGASNEAPEVALGNDAPKLAGLFGISRNRLVFGAAPHPLADARGRPKGRSPALGAAVGLEVQIALDGKAELAADGGQFDDADVAELLGPHPRALALRARLQSVQNGSCRFSRSGARCIARLAFVTGMWQRPEAERRV
jgi:hypothetical protein